MFEPTFFFFFCLLFFGIGTKKMNLWSSEKEGKENLLKIFFPSVLIPIILEYAPCRPRWSCFVLLRCYYARGLLVPSNAIKDQPLSITLVEMNRFLTQEQQTSEKKRFITIPYTDIPENQFISIAKQYEIETKHLTHIHIVWYASFVGAALNCMSLPDYASVFWIWWMELDKEKKNPTRVLETMVPLFQKASLHNNYSFIELYNSLIIVALFESTSPFLVVANGNERNAICLLDTMLENCFQTRDSSLPVQMFMLEEDDKCQEMMQTSKRQDIFPYSLPEWTTNPYGKGENLPQALEKFYGFKGRNGQPYKLYLEKITENGKAVLSKVFSCENVSRARLQLIHLFQ